MITGTQRVWKSSAYFCRAASVSARCKAALALLSSEDSLPDALSSSAACNKPETFSAASKSCPLTAELLTAAFSAVSRTCTFVLRWKEAEMRQACLTLSIFLVGEGFTQLFPQRFQALLLAGRVCMHALLAALHLQPGCMQGCLLLLRPLLGSLAALFQGADLQAVAAAITRPSAIGNAAGLSRAGCAQCLSPGSAVGHVHTAAA